MPFEFGDVVLVPFPFTNQLAFKQRPAVVISNRTYNVTRPDIILMAITSQVNSLSAGDLPVTQWQAAGLLKPSSIKPVFVTLEQNLILKRLGALESSDRAALRQAIAAVLG